MLQNLWEPLIDMTIDIAENPVRELESPFIVHASSSKEKARRTLKIIKECWDNLQKETLSKEELELAKAKLLGNIAHSSQTISQRAERKAHLIGINISDNHDEELIEKIKSITINDIHYAAIKHLKNPILSLSGPKNCLKDLTTYWNLIGNNIAKD